MFQIKLCKTKAAYSVKPANRMKLDLGKLKQKYKTSIDTPICIVIDDFGGVVVHEYGEIVFKKLTDEKKIRSIAEEIYEVAKR